MVYVQNEINVIRRMVVSLFSVVKQLQRNQLTMYFFTVHQWFKFGHSQRFHRIQIFCLPNHSSQIWIICTGEFLRKWKIINLHGFYGTYGRDEITVFNNMDINPMDTINWPKRNILLWSLGWGTCFTYTKDGSKYGGRGHNPTIHTSQMVFYGLVMERSWTFYQDKVGIALGSGCRHLSNEMYEEFTSVSCHICNQLFIIG